VTMHNITPSTGRRAPVYINLNRLRVKPGERVFYWSPNSERAKATAITDHASDDGNYWLMPDGETLLVTNIIARVPDGFTEAAEAAVLAELDATDGTLTTWARMDLCDRHGLA